MRPQIALPSQVDFRGLAPQGCRPAGIRHVYRPPAVAAKLVREAEQQEFFLPMLCRLACVVEECTPAFVGDVVLYQILHSLPALGRGGTARFLAMFGFLVLGVRRQAAKVGNRQSTVVLMMRRLRPADTVGWVVAVTEMLVKCGKRAG